MSSFLRRNEIKLVVVDWFGVLSPNFYWREQSKVYLPLKMWCDQIFGNSDILDTWMRGKCKLSDLLRFSESISEKEIIELFLADIKYYAPDVDLLMSLQHLFPHAEFVLATDNFSLFDYIVEHYTELNNFFTRIYTSYKIGLLKADCPASLFHFILEDRQMNKFADSILIDDSSQNCSIFKSLGGRVIHVD